MWWWWWWWFRTADGGGGGGAGHIRTWNQHQLEHIQYQLHIGALAGSPSTLLVGTGIKCFGTPIIWNGGTGRWGLDASTRWILVVEDAFQVMEVLAVVVLDLHSQTVGAGPTGQDGHTGGMVVPDQGGAGGPGADGELIQITVTMLVVRKWYCRFQNITTGAGGGWICWSR